MSRKKKQSLFSFFSFSKQSIKANKNPEPISLTAEELRQEQMDYYNSFEPVITDAKPDYNGEPL